MQQKYLSLQILLRNVALKDCPPYTMASSYRALKKSIFQTASLPLHLKGPHPNLYIYPTYICILRPIHPQDVNNRLINNSVLATLNYKPFELKYSSSYKDDISHYHNLHDVECRGKKHALFFSLQAYYSRKTGYAYKSYSDPQMLSIC